MAITTVSSREFNQRTNEAKKAAENGPVFITDRGRTAHALIAFDEYLRITDKGRSILELLTMPGDLDIDLEPDPIQGGVLRAWLDDYAMPAFAGRMIIPIGLGMVLRGAKFHVPDPHPVRDGLIAATALLHGMAVVTRNTTYFESTGARLFNPGWRSSAAKSLCRRSFHVTQVDCQLVAAQLFAETLPASKPYNPS